MEIDQTRHEEMPLAASNHILVNREKRMNILRLELKKGYQSMTFESIILSSEKLEVECELVIKSTAVAPLQPFRTNKEPLLLLSLSFYVSTSTLVEEKIYFELYKSIGLVNEQQLVLQNESRKVFAYHKPRAC